MSVLPIGVTRAVTTERMRDLAVAGALILWLAYTRIYWLLQAAHLGAPPCPFYYWTGHPCPFCGGTRSFAYMWRGDISDAVRLYPFGPLLFVGTIATVGTLVGRCYPRTDLGAAAEPGAVAGRGRWGVGCAAHQLGAQGVRPRQLAFAG